MRTKKTLLISSYEDYVYFLVKTIHHLGECVNIYVNIATNEFYSDIAGLLPPNLIQKFWKVDYIMNSRKFRAIVRKACAIAFGLGLATVGAATAPAASALTLYSHFEDFEDGQLNTPGVTASGGFVLSPGLLTDSVQGANPGFGSTGFSYYSDNNRSLRFTFNKAQLGGLLPTTAGLTWTDVGLVDGDIFPSFTGRGTVIFRAFSETNQLLAEIIREELGDGRVTGETIEDSVFSVTDLNGIGAIEIAMSNSSDWEIDNLQYSAVPTPALLPGLIGFSISMWRKRKSELAEESAAES